MKKIYQSLSIFLLIVGISAASALAQKDSTKLNQSVEVVKAYRPSISNANKVSLMPVIDDTTRFTPDFKYTIDSQPVRSGFEASPIGAANVVGNRSKDLGLGYLKLGAGTINTYFGEFFLNLPKSAIGTAGIHLRHLSSDGMTKLRAGDEVDAPYSQNNAAIFGAVNIGSTVLTTNLAYDRNALRYYGYPVELPPDLSGLSDTVFGKKQIYQNGDFNISLKNSENAQGALQFDAGLRLGFFDAKTGQKETRGGFFGKFDYNFGQFTGVLDLSYDHFSTKNIDIESAAIPGIRTNDWLKIAPSVRIDGTNWTLRGGLNFVNVSEKEGDNSTKLYPDFEFNFRPIAGILTLYAGFKGDLKNNTYGTIASENFWVNPHHNARNTNYTYVASGGLKGKISREISYNLGLKYSQVKDLYFYVLNGYGDITSGTTPAQLIYNNSFDMIYDNAGIFNLSTEFSYISGKDLSVVLKGNYYNYNLQTLAFAPQKPNFDLTASAGFRIIDQLTGFADIEVIGERKALVKQFSLISSSDPQSVPFSVDPSVQVNLGATYDLTSKFKLFGRVNNLLNLRNEQWLGYASQGLRMIAGVTYSF